MASNNCSKDLEIIQITVQRLIDSRNKKAASSVNGSESLPEPEDDDEQKLLAELIFQLECLKDERNPKDANSLDEVKEVSPSSEVVSDATEDNGPDAIVKELKKVRRQNTITHCLLAASIFFTAAWQLSELSMVLTVKDGLTHPFRSAARGILGMFKRPAMNGKLALDNGATSDGQDNHSNGSSLLPKFPDLPDHMDLELPYVDVPGMALNSGSFR